MTGRACHAIEIDPTYVDVAVLRWQNFTGAQATHADGRSFAAVAAERPKPAALKRRPCDARPQADPEASEGVARQSRAPGAAARARARL